MFSQVFHSHSAELPNNLLHKIKCTSIFAKKKYEKHNFCSSSHFLGKNALLQPGPDKFSLFCHQFIKSLMISLSELQIICALKRDHNMFYVEVGKTSQLSSIGHLIWSSGHNL